MPGPVIDAALLTKVIDELEPQSADPATMPHAARWTPALRGVAACPG